MEYQRWPSPFSLPPFFYSAPLFVQDAFLFLWESVWVTLAGAGCPRSLSKGFLSTEREAEPPSIGQNQKPNHFGQKQLSLCWSRTKLSRSLDWTIFLPGLLQNMLKPVICRDSLAGPWDANFTQLVCKIRRNLASCDLLKTLFSSSSPSSPPANFAFESTGFEYRTRRKVH